MYYVFQHAFIISMFLFAMERHKCAILCVVKGFGSESNTASNNQENCNVVWVFDSPKQSNSDVNYIWNNSYIWSAVVDQSEEWSSQ